MPLLQRSTIPNAITVGRIILAPAVFFLIFVPGFWSRTIAFVLFLVAAISDLWDGYLARKHGWITDFGKLVDPIADKLLLAATFIPFYVLSNSGAEVGELPVIGPLPLWIVLVIFGREALITGVRAVVARRGTVIPAGRSGKHKAVMQNIFIGAVLVWYALQSLALTRGWAGTAWAVWQVLHTAVILISLVLAVGLTVYSMIVYLWGWRRLVREAVR